MNHLLGELEQLGYLVRSDDRTDKRSRLIELTTRGHALSRVMRESVTGIEAELERDLGHDQLARLRELLADLNATNFVREYREQTGQPAIGS